MIGNRSAGHDSLNAVYHQLNGRISVGMSQHRHTTIDHHPDAPSPGCRIIGRICDVIRFGAFRPLGVGLRHPGRTPLGRAIQSEFDATVSDAAHVFCIPGHRLQLLICQRVPHHVGHYVSRERLFECFSLQQFHISRRQIAVLNGGNAVAGI